MIPSRRLHRASIGSGDQLLFKLCYLTNQYIYIFIYWLVYIYMYIYIIYIYEECFSKRRYSSFQNELACHANGKFKDYVLVKSSSYMYICIYMYIFMKRCFHKTCSSNLVLALQHRCFSLLALNAFWKRGHVYIYIYMCARTLHLYKYVYICMYIYIYEEFL